MQNPSQPPDEHAPRSDLWLFLAIVLALLPLRIMRLGHIRHMDVDGGYYVEVARHVRDGYGLMSHESLYHMGSPHLPYPTGIYPLWPLILGYAARLGDLATLSHTLPFALSLTALGAAFLFGRRLWPEPMMPNLLPAFNGGHLLVVMLGLQQSFSYYSVLPYTEPLSFTLLFGMLWRMLVARPGPLAALEAAAWAMLCYFTRYQLIIAPAALLLAQGLRVLTGPARGRAAGELAVSGAVIGGTLLAFWMWLRSFLPGAGPGALLRFDQHRASEVLAPFDVIVDNHSLAELVVDRAGGLITAWDSLSSQSYQVAFYASHWALPVAIVFGVPALIRALRAEGLSALLAPLRGPRAVAWVTTLALAAGGLASVHLAHKHWNGGWYFDDRQSMIVILAFFLAMGWLFRQRRGLPVLIAGMLLSTSTLVSLRQDLEMALNDDGTAMDEEDLDPIVDWLNRHSERDPLTVVMATGKVQLVGWRTTNVGYQWFYEETSYADLLKMCDVLGAQYVIYSETGTRKWRFRKEGVQRLKDDFEVLPEKPNSLLVLKRKVGPKATVPAGDPELLNIK